MAGQEQARSDMAPRILLEGMNQICSCLAFNLPKVWPYVDLCLLSAACLVRLGIGSRSAKGIEKCDRPSKPLILYDSQTEIDCKKVREVLSMLELDYLCYPCPREFMRKTEFPVNSRFVPDLIKTGGLNKVPLLVDEPNKVKIYLAPDAIKYLWDTYGAKAERPTTLVSFLLKNEHAGQISQFLLLMLRPCMWMGILRAPSRRPEQPLEVWGYENAPRMRRVQEALTSLEMPYLFHSVPRDASLQKREAYLKERGAGVAKNEPVLYDPNHKEKRVGATDILFYLRDRYQTFPAGEDTWFDSKAKEFEFVHVATACLILCVLLTPPCILLLLLFLPKLSS